ncbi:MAG: transcriptional regulator NrdR [Candidatus Sumerlaeia bacterium]
MKCPFCGSMKNKVVNTRLCQAGEAIRRRRECLACNSRYTTIERIEKSPISVVKRDGKTRELYDRDKLMRGIRLACNKRPISSEQIEKLVNSVERAIYNNLSKEITSQEIGDQVLKRLRELDEVAFLRFASVYRRYNSIKEFNEEIQKLHTK